MNEKILATSRLIQVHKVILYAVQENRNFGQD